MTAIPEQLTTTQVLRFNHVRTYLSGFLLDSVGDILWYLTLGWVAARAPNGLVTGLILCAGAAPAAALMLFGGAIIDRIGTGRAACYTLAARAAIMLIWIVAVGAHLAPLTVVATLAFFIGVVEGLHRPALETWPTALLPPEGQTSALGLERLGGRAAQIAGGVLGGWLLSAWSLSGPSIVAALAFAIALTVFVRLTNAVPTRAPDVETGSDLLAAARGGLRAVREHPVLSRTLPAHGLFNALTGGLSLTAFPLKAHALHWSGAQFGALYAGWGVGLLLGTMALLRLVNAVARKIRLAAVLMGAAGVCAAGIGLSDRFFVVLMLAAVLGLCCGPVGPSLGGYLRAVAMSRVNTGAVQGAQALALDGVEPFGYLAVGGLVAVAGIAGGCTIVGIVLVGLCGWVLAARSARLA